VLLPFKIAFNECLEDSFGSSFTSGLPDFSWYNLPTRGKIYQITTKYLYTQMQNITQSGHPASVPRRQSIPEKD
jgi:hypothetical protein